MHFWKSGTQRNNAFIFSFFKGLKFTIMLPCTLRLSKKPVVSWFSRYNVREYVYIFSCILHTLPISLVILGVFSELHTTLCSQTLPLLHCAMLMCMSVCVCVTGRGSSRVH